VTWLFWLAAAVVVTAAMAVAGIQTKGTRPIEHTSMMGVGRIALLAILVIFAYVALRASVGG
jgi:hypothetical protein